MVWVQAKHRRAELTIWSISRPRLTTETRGTTSLPTMTLVTKGCTRRLRFVLMRPPGGLRAQQCRSAQIKRLYYFEEGAQAFLALSCFLTHDHLMASSLKRLTLMVHAA